MIVPLAHPQLIQVLLIPRQHLNTTTGRGFIIFIGLGLANSDRNNNSNNSNDSRIIIIIMIIIVDIVFK
jgi:hypothetical protein